MPTFIGAGPVANRVAVGGGLDTALSLDLTPLAAEYLANFTAQVQLGFGNAWSLSVWAKPDLNASGENVGLFGAYDATGAADNSRIRVLIRDIATPDLNVVIYDDTLASIIKLYRYTNAVPSAGNWAHWVITWNGTTLQVYYNGSAVSPTASTIDLVGTMADAVRDPLIGDEGSGVGGAGRMGHVALWSTVLGAGDVTEIESQGFDFDPTVDGGGYNESASAVHWWAVGARGTIATAGQDEIGNIDCIDQSGTLTDGDIVMDAPA